MNFLLLSFLVQPAPGPQQPFFSPHVQNPDFPKSSGSAVGYCPGVCNPKDGSDPIGFPLKSKRGYPQKAHPQIPPLPFVFQTMSYFSLAFKQIYHWTYCGWTKSISRRLRHPGFEPPVNTVTYNGFNHGSQLVRTDHSEYGLLWRTVFYPRNMQVCLFSGSPQDGWVSFGFPLARKGWPQKRGTA